MTDKNFYPLDKLLTAVIEKVKESEKDVYIRYVNETLVKCGELCEKGEEVRALTEIKHMLINLKEEFEL